ncbi:hypothetical protein GIB67_038318 [Kingdonia uniflora]|uniref:Potassium transporter n=1 Tax=Kingdonia uniflora TaxID=39325 RepID=A0A7J7KUM3_9MAGN|nr:hypothetical protein GIB67_038318 [Kingdonia uniflora]
MEDQAPEHEADTDEAMETTKVDTLKERKVSWAKLRRVDSLNMEAGNVSNVQSHDNSKVDWRMTLLLAYQSVGVIYGDIGTSPLYVYSSTFTNKIPNTDDILGVLSLIIYTIILSPMLKYVFIVLRANDNGDGGTFALYSLICRYAKVSLLPNHQAEDKELSNYRLETPSNRLGRATKVKAKLEKSKVAPIVLLLLTVLGTSMVIGDGILTPAISVLSAVGGIKESAKSLNQDAIVGISVLILICLFSAQRFGTDKVGYSFAPIILIWFSVIGGIGIYNLFKHDIKILRAFNPIYIIDYFKRNGKDGYISLGGVVLCITGTEAMFADLGHFSVRAVQISFSGVVFPSLLCAYIGQAAYLTKFPENVADTFYKSIPHAMYWPTFVVAVAASIIASQAMISGSFAIISQALSLGCFPRVKVVHTSTKYEGQVYIPELNYMIMTCSILVTVAFRTTEKIGHAYGIAVVAVMAITTHLTSLIMLIIWKISVWKIILFYMVFATLELTYLSSVLSKFVQGGYLPLAFSFCLMTMMGIWHYVYRGRYMFELKNKVSSSFMKDLVKNQYINRVPGIGFLYSELVEGIPPIFPHFISNIPSIHSVLVFVSIKHIPISKVLMEERFLFRQVEPRDYRMFRCVVRYGYKDAIQPSEEFERQLIQNLIEFVRHEYFFFEGNTTEQTTNDDARLAHSGILVKERDVSESGASKVHSEPPRVSSGSIRPRSSNGIISCPIQGATEEMEFIQRAAGDGVVYLLGETDVIAEPKSSIFKRIIVNYIYYFLRRNFRQGEKALLIPQSKLLRVGMTYEI